MRWFPLAVLALGAVGATLIVASMPRRRLARARRPRLSRRPDEWRAAGAL
jgi:hypothetical protein